MTETQHDKFVPNDGAQVEFFFPEASLDFLNDIELHSALAESSRDIQPISDGPGESDYMPLAYALYLSGIGGHASDGEDEDDDHSTSTLRWLVSEFRQSMLRPPNVADHLIDPCRVRLSASFRAHSL